MSEQAQFRLSKAALDEIQGELAKYPSDRRQSALMATLRIAQDEHGWLSPELIAEVAGIIGVPVVRAYEVATFYSMYDLEPVGRHKIEVCTNVSCMLRGCDQVVGHLKQRLGIDFNQTTEDGKFTLREVECLAACAGAPMMAIGHDYYENLNEEKIDLILEGLE
ncbi:MAG: NADH-quinone oxidoreductase subunit NuoE [Gammaproteobacteria bacterium]|nr:NADH-quinone oxidoreductase subunit NuoE [Gammaproteobacteria bacterium]MCY4228558.1 NADH-quinone oxidoreductase subunit NuoE [Gammaproteobacteria bacterium]MCY4313247.1 NADH-quinone oxidoreductase subunit NuoE [Gammaproteobacteria bacterium]